MPACDGGTRPPGLAGGQEPVSTGPLVAGRGRAAILQPPPAAGEAAVATVTGERRPRPPPLASARPAPRPIGGAAAAEPGRLCSAISGPRHLRAPSRRGRGRAGTRRDGPLPRHSPPPPPGSGMVWLLL
nr:uncharacterized protein C11orf96-like isoform X2 [Anser cygnoides]